VPYDQSPRPESPSVRFNHIVDKLSQDLNQIDVVAQLKRVFEEVSSENGLLRQEVNHLQKVSSRIAHYLKRVQRDLHLLLEQSQSNLKESFTGYNGTNLAAHLTANHKSSESLTNVRKQSPDKLHHSHNSRLSSSVTPRGILASSTN
jgi:hypothetical protein